MIRFTHVLACFTKVLSVWLLPHLGQGGEACLLQLSFELPQFSLHHPLLLHQLLDLHQPLALTSCILG